MQEPSEINPVFDKLLLSKPPYINSFKEGYNERQEKVTFLLLKSLFSQVHLPSLFVFNTEDEIQRMLSKHHH